MITVFKYEIKFPEHGTCRTSVKPPEHAKILCVGTQVKLHGQDPEENLFLWAQVNTQDQATRTQELLVLGTGHDLDSGVDINNYKYINTAFYKQHVLVYHVYERIYA